ncbi:MAG: hypothetical protein ACRDGM_00815 [bacterium]
MISPLSWTRLLLHLVLVVLAPASAIAQDSSFQRVQLPHKISLEIPAHWKVLSAETRKNLAAAGEAITGGAGVEVPSGKESLLAVNATPDPPGAMIRVSVISPPEYTQADLAAVTPAELKDAEEKLLNLFKKIEAAGGPKILEVQRFRIERLNNHLSLVMPYIRASAQSSSPWQAVQYKIPVSGRLIELTLSNRQSDAIVWKPILERVKRSLRFESPSQPR